MFTFVIRLLQSENCLIANLMNSDAFYDSEHFKAFKERLYAGLDPFISFLIFKFKFIDFKKTKFKFIDFAKTKFKFIDCKKTKFKFIGFEKTKFKFIDFAKVEFKFVSGIKFKFNPTLLVCQILGPFERLAFWSVFFCFVQGWIHSFFFNF